MKKNFVIITLFMLLLLASCSTLAFRRTGGDGTDSQISKPVLGILPFYGGAAREGETIAEIFSPQPVLLQHFNVVTRSSAALEAIYAERNLQRLTGLTDSDAIADVGRVLNADYVLYGSIRKLGDRNLLIATLINVKTFEQVSGTYATYGSIDETPKLLPGLSKDLVKFITNPNNAIRENLAIVPITRLHDGISSDDTDTLTQILAIELTKTGKYAILPRTSAIQLAKMKQDNETEGEGIMQIGSAINAEYVISGTIGILGSLNVFSTQIIRVANGRLVMGKSENFTAITEGINLMSEMAVLLTEPDENKAQVQIAKLRQARAIEEAELKKKQDKEKREKDAQAAKIVQAKEIEAAKEKKLQDATDRKTERIRTAGQRSKNAKRTEVEFLSASYTWGNTGNGKEPQNGVKAMALLSGAYWSPLPYLNIGIEPSMTLFGILKPGYKFDFQDFYFSIAPSAGVIIPFGSEARMFANFTADMGHLPGGGTFYHKSLSKITLGISPGLNAGFSFGQKGTFNLKYSCVFNGQKEYGNYLLTHSVGIGFGHRY